MTCVQTSELSRNDGALLYTKLISAVSSDDDSIR
jgi:hypothetical protein